MALTYSVQGIKFALSKQTAFRQEAVIGIILIPLALLFGETGIEKAFLIYSILLVLIVELINSSIETTIDRIGSEKMTCQNVQKIWLLERYSFRY
tara:strand:- start:168 stop:452 length:285 start_codon:yes stop_codon:yes gene_type:complete